MKLKNRKLRMHNTEKECLICKQLIYREDGTCMNCLIKETKSFLKKTCELVKSVKKENNNAT